METPRRAVLDALCATVPSWLRAPAWDDEGIVLSTRVRVARNLDGFCFPHHSGTGEREAVLGRIDEALEVTGALADRDRLDVDALTDADRTLLVERHLISEDLASGTGPRAVYVAEEEAVSLLVNEEDHLRAHTVSGGLSPTEAWARLERLDAALGESLRYAYRPGSGYLTACPTNVGTGLRVSVLLHLPALVLTEEAEGVLRSAAGAGMLVRGIHGSGSSVFGNLFSISNRQTLGRSETDILESVQRTAHKAMEHERSARATLLKEARLQTEDKIHRALGLLRSARVLSARESLNLLSAVRLGVNMYVLSDVGINTLNELMIQTRPSHLERREGRTLSPGERDILRADLVRARLNAPGGGSDPNE